MDLMIVLKLVHLIDVNIKLYLKIMNKTTITIIRNSLRENI